MPLKSMPPEMINKIARNLCYVDRKALFDASSECAVLRDKIEPSLYLDPLSKVVYASLYAYEGRCNHVTAALFKEALNDIETGLRCLLGKTHVEYFEYHNTLPYAPDKYTITTPSELKAADKKQAEKTPGGVERHYYLHLLLQPRCNGQAHYEFYLEAMETYDARRSNDPGPLLPVGCRGGRVDIALYDTLKRVRSYVYDWICEVQCKEKTEQGCIARRRERTSYGGLPHALIWPSSKGGLPISD